MSTQRFILPRLQRWRRRAHDERGAELLEFISVLPLVLFAALLLWQFLLLGYTASTVSSAAREGARAMAVGGDCPTAARNASFNWDDGQRQISCRVAGSTVEATVSLQVFRTELPFFGYLPEYPWISSTAVARYEPQPN